MVLACPGKSAQSVADAQRLHPGKSEGQAANYRYMEPQCKRSTSNVPRRPAKPVKLSQSRQTRSKQMARPATACVNNQDHAPEGHVCAMPAEARSTTCSSVYPRTKRPRHDDRETQRRKRSRSPKVTQKALGHSRAAAPGPQGASR